MAKAKEQLLLKIEQNGVVSQKTLTLKDQLTFGHHQDNDIVIPITVIEEIDQCAMAMHSLGLRKDDRMTIAMPTTPQGIICFYAINKMNCRDVNTL